MLSQALDSLNAQQRQAVSAAPGPILVMAGPGSGKTRVLSYRIAYLVHELGVPPYRILAVTFTNKAAREMEARVEGLLNPAATEDNAASGVNLGTFHAISARLLRREVDRLPVERNFVIFDQADQLSLVNSVLKALNLDPKQFQPRRVHAAISRAKNELIQPQDYIADSYFAEIVGRVYERYQVLLVANNALDFDDLLLWPVRLLQDDPILLAKYRRRYPHLLVDEFQDTNTVQYAFLRLLAGEAPDLFVVGDPDQSIYRWRGADYRNVRRFQQDYPEARVILLEQSYRSTQTILDAAMAIIDRQTGRQRKQLFTERGRGLKITLHEAYDDAEEARFVVETIALLTVQGEYDPGDCAVMYRTNAQSRAIEEAFLRAGLPYRLVGAQRFYGRREVKDLIAYLRLIHNPADEISLLRVLNTPPRGIGAKTVTALIERAEKAGLSPAQLLLELANPDSEFQAAFDARAQRALAGFGRQLRGWLEAAPETHLVELMDQVLDEVGYQGFIDDGTEEGAERWANIHELRAVASEFEDLGLAEFLEQIALISDQDTLSDEQNAPTLLTLHAAKGLEFPVVFITGLDDGVLPHQRSFDEPDAMAEERRLLYVGLTRAKDRLFLIRALRRRGFGGALFPEPSRYLDDLPADLLQGNLVHSDSVAQASYERQIRWEPSPPPPPSKPARQTRFRVGMHVSHRSFGPGVVMASEHVGGDEEVTVAFESAGIKRLVASLARLEVKEIGD